MKNIRYFAIALALGFASLFSHQDAHAQPFGLITVKDASGVKIDEMMIKGREYRSLLQKEVTATYKPKMTQADRERGNFYLDEISLLSNVLDAVNVLRLAQSLATGNEDLLRGSQKQPDATAIRFRTICDNMPSANVDFLSNSQVLMNFQDAADANAKKLQVPWRMHEVIMKSYELRRAMAVEYVALCKRASDPKNWK